MKTIDINLYPYKKIKDNKLLNILEKFLPPVFIALSIAVFLNITFFFLTLFSSNVYTRLNKEWKKDLPKVSILTALKQEVNSLKDKKERYLTVINLKTESAKILSSIFEAIPKNIWLDELNYTGNSLVFVGYAVKWKEEPLLAVDTFIKNLKKGSFTQISKDINLRNWRKINLSGTEVIKFDIECKILK